MLSTGDMVVEIFLQNFVDIICLADGSLGDWQWMYGHTQRNLT